MEPEPLSAPKVPGVLLKLDEVSEEPELPKRL